MLILPRIFEDEPLAYAEGCIEPSHKDNRRDAVFLWPKVKLLDFFWVMFCVMVLCHHRESKKQRAGK